MLGDARLGIGIFDRYLAKHDFTDEFSAARTICKMADNRVALFLGNFVIDKGGDCFRTNVPLRLALQAFGRHLRASRNLQPPD